MNIAVLILGYLELADKKQTGLCFNITDDRRDRILAMKTMMLDSGYVGFLGIYDLRFAEDFSTASAGSKEFTGDLSMYSLAAIGNYKA